MSDPVIKYNELKLAQALTGYRNLANSVNALGNRGDPDAYDKVRFGKIINPPTIQLTYEEKRQKELDRHLKEYRQTQAEYKRRQEAAKAEAEAKAAAAPKSPKSPKSQKSPKSPSKGSKGGSKRNRRNNRNRTYRGRPTRSRSSRRNA